MLEHNWLFKGLTAIQIAALEREAIPAHIPKDTVVFHEGDSGEDLYVILEGSAKAVRQDGSGRQVILNHFGPDDCFGEMSFLDGAPRCATIVTRQACDVLILPRRAFVEMVLSDPRIYQNITGFLLQKIRSATQKIEDLSVSSVYTRLARILSEFQGLDGVLTEPLTQQEIAEMVGASRETVCRLINDLDAKGYLSRKNSRMVIRKRLPLYWK